MTTSLASVPLDTPAFIYDETRILSAMELLVGAREASGCRMLYSIKALPLEPVLRLLAPRVDGFSVSSLFEARLAADQRLPLHITTPGLRTDEIAEIGELCDYLAFNSLEQCRRLLPRLGNRASAGLRVNPGLSFLADSRYDPCGPFSKLGVPLDDLAQALSDRLPWLERIEGLHFHTLFSSTSFDPMALTLARIERELGERFLSRLRWINLGGGYVFEREEDLAGLVAVASDLRLRFGLRVYFEPGKALVGKAGYLVAAVIDRFRRDGKTVAVLDTTVNHHPEIFEYQIRPQPAWAEPEEGETALLAGCTCLAGDVFGEYRFERLPEMGEKLAFANVGAYSLVKANGFNGYPLPSVYLLDASGNARRVKRQSFETYRAMWSADDSEA